MTPEDIRRLQQSYEDACQTTLDSLRLCQVARDVVSKSRELVNEAHEVSECAKAGDA
jgi:hypothetical protein